MTAKTREPQYQFCVDYRDRSGLTPLGLMTNQCWQDDPRRMAFFLARYKFVSKMLRGKQSALEVGCGDAFGTRIVRQEVSRVVAIDFDPVFIEDANRRMDPKWQFECRIHDMLAGPTAEKFEAAYSLDVLEHILPQDEDRFLGNIAASLTDDGVCIQGSPSLQSQSYASKASKEGHVNCKDHEAFRLLMRKYYHNVFMFSMNDEVVHTGFGPMAHYLIAMGVGPRR
ncbi:MAG TPA: class I SAM-dependent methyltransferase [Gemmataceae bacterium]|nr:class I SAM-dependent methyltransferase [Gemmataceae bacterium]